MTMFMKVVKQNPDFYVKYAQNWQLMDETYDNFPRIKNNYIELICNSDY